MRRCQNKGCAPMLAPPSLTLLWVQGAKANLQRHPCVAHARQWAIRILSRTSGTPVGVASACRIGGRPRGPSALPPLPVCLLDTMGVLWGVCWAERAALCPGAASLSRRVACGDNYDLWEIRGLSWSRPLSDSIDRIT